MKSKLILAIAIMLFSIVPARLQSQTSAIAIHLNEYSATNVTGPVDAFGVHSDWVELHNIFTSQVNLTGYYLSNDPKNLKKWRIPGGFTMDVDEYKLIWLSGKNRVINGEYHANFTLDQCRNQYLILSAPDLAFRDSVFIQKTKADHSRGRVDASGYGIKMWRLYTSPSPGGANNTLTNYYYDYAPTPQFVLATQAPSSFSQSPQPGGWYEGAQIGYFKLGGFNYDTLTSCYDIFYTKNGNYPLPVYLTADSAEYFRVFDSITPIAIDQTTILRFIAVPKVKSEFCTENKFYLPSFCETNTYFIDPEHKEIRKDWGVVSLAIDYPDTSWFTSSGNPPNTTVHVEYYDKFNQVTEGYGVINRPVNEEWRTRQRGFYISIEDRRGFGCNFEGPIFNVDSLGASPRTVFPTLHLKAGDIESHSGDALNPDRLSDATAIRDVFIQSLAIKNKLNVNALHIKPVLAFINGMYAGVYDLREVFDKYYEGFYNGQSMDSVNMRFYHASSDGFVTYTDGSNSNGTANFRSDVYDYIMNNPMSITNRYNTVMSRLDKASFMDYMILNSFFSNSDNWKNNVAFAKGTVANKPGYKWHYYLWNMPSTMSYTFISNQLNPYNSPFVSICNIHRSLTGVSLFGGNGHGNMLAQLMGTSGKGPTFGNVAFQHEYKTRYMDLLNGPLKCETLLQHFDYIQGLYGSEMRCMEQECPRKQSPFKTTPWLWDSAMARLRIEISKRCFYAANSFSAAGCYGQQGPFNITVNVEPEGAGRVRLNSTMLEQYPWNGNYFATTLAFKAFPANSQYEFHHWEFKAHPEKLPLSMDTNAIVFTRNEEVTAVFIDKSRGITVNGDQINVPTGFTPNGDGLNDYFRPLGASKFVTDYEITIWNRWGEEVFRSVDPEANGWDGSFKGQSAVTGVYAFVIRYRNIYGEAKIEKGNVTLTR